MVLNAGTEIHSCFSKEFDLLENSHVQELFEDHIQKFEKA